jgi:hypothetical protein
VQLVKNASARKPNEIKIIPSAIFSGFIYFLLQFFAMTASDPIPTAIPTSNEAILNHDSTSGSIDIPTEVAVASKPATQALNDGVSIFF